jgi:hypothetical protein
MYDEMLLRSRHFRNKENEYLKAKVGELETNVKVKNIGDLYRVKLKVKQSRYRPGVAQRVPGS